MKYTSSWNSCILSSNEIHSTQLKKTRNPHERVKIYAHSINCNAEDDQFKQVMILETEILLSPRDDDDKVHDVPEVPHVAVGVEDEAEGQDLGAHLDREDHHEDGLQVFLQSDGENDFKIQSKLFPCFNFALTF